MPIRIPHFSRRNHMRGLHSAAAFTLVCSLVAGLACGEKALTETRAPAGPTDIGSGDEGDLVAQGDVSAMAIQLPVNQSVATATPNPAFRVNQTGTGPNGIFQISRTGSSATALQGLTNGMGRAGVFRIQNAANPLPALLAEANGSGPTVWGLATGGGAAGFFQVRNARSSNFALSATTNGTGSAGEFQISSAQNTSPALFVFTRGTGNALQVTSSNAAAKAATFVGKVHITGNLSVGGTLTKGAGSFKIDHPLDPGHKYLSHSFVESPDMMNVYNGNVTLDTEGRATVELPDYFEALNRDFRYQLTAIGAPGPNLYIAEGVQQNRFQIAGGRPYARVSWQVTGVRQDAYANEHRIKVEEDKPQREKKPLQGDLVARR